MKKNKLTFTILIFIFIINTLVFNSVSYAADETTLEVDVPVAILMERGTNNILFEKNATDIRFPASTAKIMTAIVVLENTKLTDTVRVTYSALDAVPSGYSIANLKIDEELTVEQLLHLLLIPSASDAANVLAEHVGGSITDFAYMMNAKALELNCTKTNFTNPDGLHDESQVTTAYDLAVMADYAMENATFRSIVSKASYILYPTNIVSTERYFKTTNLLLNESSNYYYSSVNGIKTGFTTPAGNCLVAAAQEDEMEVIIVILGAGQTDDGSSARFLTAEQLLDYSFGNFTYKTIKYETDIVGEIEVKGATQDTKNLGLALDDKIHVFLNKSDLETDFVPALNLKEDIKAPILKGDVLGTATFTIEDIEYTANVVASSDVYKSNALFIGLVVIALLGIILLRMKSVKSKKSMIKTNYRVKKKK